MSKTKLSGKGVLRTPTRISMRLRSQWIVALCFLAAVALVEPQSIAMRLALQQDNRLIKHDPEQRRDERRIALVIGNGAYKNVGQLRNPTSDATLLAVTLKKLGFEVTVGNDKSQREMKQLIREFGQRLRLSGSVGLFYFAGHGVQAKGRNYLIPVDAEIQTEADLEDAAVDINYVLNLMDDAQNALNLVILDACRNNPFVRNFRSAQEGLAQVKAPTGTLIAYATAPDSIAADGGGANSPYAEELTRQMRTPGVVLETMFRRVTEQVSSRTGGRQEPWFSDNHKGEFYFSKSPPTSSGSESKDTYSNQPAKIDAVAVEREYWETIRGSSDPKDYKDYVTAYPDGAYVAVARAKIRQFETAKNTDSTSDGNGDIGRAKDNGYYELTLEHAKASYNSKNCFSGFVDVSTDQKMVAVTFSLRALSLQVPSITTSRDVHAYYILDPSQRRFEMVCGDGRYFNVSLNSFEGKPKAKTLTVEFLVPRSAHSLKFRFTPGAGNPIVLSLPNLL